MSKRLYQGGCSFLQSPDVTVDTCLSDTFKNWTNINNCMGGSSNPNIFRKALFSILNNDFDFVLIGWSQPWRNDTVADVFEENKEYSDNLIAESESDILTTSHYYQQIINNRGCFLEPQGTDTQIMNTIILHKLLKSKNIPHLFVSMGDQLKQTVQMRKNWLKHIDPKNYFGEGDIVDKMCFSVINYFSQIHYETFGNDYQKHWTYVNTASNIRDNAMHLNEKGMKHLASMIQKHINDNGLL
jgi:hypothetical protein